MQDTHYFEAPRVGHLAPGQHNRISDVAGVTVGHATLADGDIQTGVTVIHTHDGDPFLEKTPAAVTVINGFGKSIGLIQVRELGVIETPIALTNTFSTGDVATAQLRQAVAQHPEIGRDWPTVNPLVLECNDGYLNDIQAFAVGQVHYDQASQHAAAAFAQGAVGAGRGMSSFHLKAGIGSASRIAVCAQTSYTVGALVLSNFGRLPSLTVAGYPLGRELARSAFSATPGALHEQDKGSIIIVLACDAPLDSRQLGRLSRRAAAGLARTGSVYGHGSGDIALAFSTAYRIPALTHTPMPGIPCLHETLLDPLFEAAAEATEQAIINALWAAVPVTGRDGHARRAISELLPQWRERLPPADAEPTLLRTPQV